MINIAILGYGTVGSGVVEVLNTNKESIALRARDDINIKYVLDLREFPGSPIESVLTKNYDDIINDDDVKIVVEVLGGVNPAYDFVKRALLAGKSVATSNKELVAAHGPELLKLAKERNINFMFEASVGGGIPIIRPLNKSLTADEIFEIEGILNGTTNYILTRMEEEGVGYEEVLKDAQELGYAEKNPAADVEGFDACRKIAILSSLAYGSNVNYEHIYTEGITKIRLKDIENAKNMGYRIKLIGSSRKINGKAYAMVAPTMIPLESPLAGVSAVFNAILIKGNVIGDVMFYGQGAGKLPTASAVVADVVEECLHLERHVATYWYSKAMPLLPKEEIPAKYYIAVEGNNNFENIEKVFENCTQVITEDNETIIVTKTSTEGQLIQKLEEIKQNYNVLSRIRIEC